MNGRALYKFSYSRAMPRVGECLVRLVLKNLPSSSGAGACATPGSLKTGSQHLRRAVNIEGFEVRPRDLRRIGRNQNDFPVILWWFAV